MTIYLNMKKLICVDNRITRNIHHIPSEKINRSQHQSYALLRIFCLLDGIVPLTVSGCKIIR